MGVEVVTNNEQHVSSLIAVLLLFGWRYALNALLAFPLLLLLPLTTFIATRSFGRRLVSERLFVR